MSLRIVIDSASDITKEKADTLGLDYMPLKTIFGDEEYLDGVTLPHYAFYEKLIESGIFPTTSQIPPHEFEKKYKEINEAGDTAIVITLSSLLSAPTRVLISHWRATRTVSTSLTAKTSVSASRILSCTLSVSATKDCPPKRL